MKKIFLFFLCIITASTVFAQDNETRKGYIGMGLGFAIPHGDLKGLDTGAQINLLNTGYLFSNNIGVTATWFGVGFSDNYNTGYSGYNGVYSENEVVTLGGMMIGPMFSTSSPGKKFDFDLRLQAGFGGGSLPDYMDYFTENEMPMALALGAGASMRWNCWKYISLSLNYDYYTAKPDFGGQIGKLKMSSSGFTMGVNFRIK